MTVSYSGVKKRGKKKCEISSQWHFKGKWYVRRFDPDIVQNGYIYSTMKEEKVFISSFSVGYAEDFSYGRDEP